MSIQIDPFAKPVSRSDSSGRFEPSTLPAGFGIDFHAQFSSNTGLGVTARHTAQALVDSGIPVRFFDRKPHFAAASDGTALDGLPIRLEQEPIGSPYPVSLYNIAAFDAEHLTASGSGGIHVPIVWWESTVLHQSWSRALMKFDLVVAYSDFTAQVLANSLHLTPTLGGRQPLYLPPGIAPNRPHLGLPQDATVFVTAFDPSSDPTRKNPGAVIAAFRNAFPSGQENVRLVFRLNKPEGTPLAQAATRWLIEQAEGDKRIGFILQPMSYSEVLALYASADVFVSLHRSEGLGLGMLESMRLGVAVIATGWSGNMSFMDHDCAGLVRYRLIPTNGNRAFLRADVLGPGAVWAEPVVEDAIAWMRMFHEIPDERRRFATAGRRHAEAYQQDALRMDWVREIVRFGMYRSHLPAVREKFSTTESPQ